MASLLKARDVAAVKKAIGQVCDTFFTYPATHVRRVFYFDDNGEARAPITEQPGDWDPEEDGEFVPESESAETELLCYRQHVSEAFGDDRFIQQNGVSLGIELKLTFDAQALTTKGFYDPATRRHLFEETDLFRLSHGEFEFVKAPETADFVEQDLIVVVYCRRKVASRPAQG